MGAAGEGEAAVATRRKAMSLQMQKEHGCLQVDASPGGLDGVGAVDGGEAAVVARSEAAQAAVQGAALQPRVEAHRLAPRRVRVVRLHHRVVVVVLCMHSSGLSHVYTSMRICMPH